MFGYVLAVTACLGASDTGCREFEILTDSLAPFGCFAVSQSMLAEWQVQHPRWTVRRYNCRAPEKRERSA